MLNWFGRCKESVAPPGEMCRPGPACFVCDGTPPPLELDQPGHWLEPRSACCEHKSAAVLLSGESLNGFLTRHRCDVPLEGSGLSYLLNPVFLSGRRVWADFVGGGWAVFEEVFASDSQFEYWAQHRSDCVDALYSLCPPAVTSCQPDWQSAGFDGQARRIQEWRGRLAAQWEYQHRIDDCFRRRGTRDFSSPAEMLDFLKSVRTEEHAVSAFGPECEEDLRGLAIRRFQQLQTKSKGGKSESALGR